MIFDFENGMVYQGRDIPVRYYMPCGYGFGHGCGMPHSHFRKRIENGVMFLDHYFECCGRLLQFVQEQGSDWTETWSSELESVAGKKRQNPIKLDWVSEEKREQRR